MDVRILIFALTAILMASCGNEAPVEKMEEVNKEPMTIDEAKSIFILHCESCHGMDGKKGSAEAADLSKSKLTDEQIRHMVENGNDKGMMPYKDIITDDREMKGIVEFVKSLRKG